jgi:hypothetical protein
MSEATCGTAARISLPHIAALMRATANPKELQHFGAFLIPHAALRKAAQLSQASIFPPKP